MGSAVCIQCVPRKLRSGLCHIYIDFVLGGANCRPPVLWVLFFHVSGLEFVVVESPGLMKNRARLKIFIGK